MKPLSFVIITYNRPDDALDLAKNISQLEKLEELVEEVIIVNNKSTVSYQLLEEFIRTQPHIPFRYFVTEENLGVSRGRNYAIRQSQAPILLFLDDDALIRNSDALSAIVEAFAEDPALGIAAFKIYYYSTGEMQVNAFPHKRFADRKDWPQFDTYYFSGAAHAIRRTVFETVGYYPENFFYGMEEYDLSFRALDAGYIIRYTDKVVILHKESPTGRLTPREKRKGMWVNKSTVAWKYLPLPYFLSTALIWSLWYLLKSKGDVGGYFRGWGSIRKMLKTEKRRPVSPASVDYLKKVKARLAY
ncbi:MAG TPA: glycosyltransferase family 2 protein [Puia sp.]|nr:glycosyltransferase family 2 protein [Puia sp.]